MRNHEGYKDPTAGDAMTEKPKRLKQITGPEKKKHRTYDDLPPGKVPAVMVTEKKTTYYATPVFVRK